MTPHAADSAGDCDERAPLALGPGSGRSVSFGGLPRNRSRQGVGTARLRDRFARPARDRRRTRVAAVPASILAGPPSCHPRMAAPSTRLPWEDGTALEAKVARDLSRIVFDEVFPILADALAGMTVAARRSLTPRGSNKFDRVRSSSSTACCSCSMPRIATCCRTSAGLYAAYCLTRIRREVADARAAGRAPSPRAQSTGARLPRHFHRNRAWPTRASASRPTMAASSRPTPRRFWNASELPDGVIAKIVFALSHVEAERGPKYVN